DFQVVMIDAQETSKGDYSFDGTRIEMRFYNGSVIYTGKVTGQAMAGTAGKGGEKGEGAKRPGLKKAPPPPGEIAHAPPRTRAPAAGEVARAAAGHAGSAWQDQPRHASRGHAGPGAHHQRDAARLPPEARLRAPHRHPGQRPELLRAHPQGRRLDLRRRGVRES